MSKISLKIEEKHIAGSNHKKVINTESRHELTNQELIQI